jgi:hypothetical protein
MMDTTEPTDVEMVPESLEDEPRIREQSAMIPRYRSVEQSATGGMGESR